jgi:hypothetical protein
MNPRSTQSSTAMIIEIAAVVFAVSEQRQAST